MMTNDRYAYLFNNVQWTRFKTPTPEEPGELYATHEGFLDLGQVRLKVYQLSDGRRVIAEESVRPFLEGLLR